MAKRKATASQQKPPKQEPQKSPQPDPPSQQDPRDQAPSYVPLTQEQVADLKRTFAPKREVKKHLRCPICFDGRGGTAARKKWQRQVNGVLLKRCYACGECGVEWVVEVRATEEEDFVTESTKVVEVRQHV